VTDAHSPIVGVPPQTPRQQQQVRAGGGLERDEQPRSTRKHGRHPGDRRRSEHDTARAHAHGHRRQSAPPRPDAAASRCQRPVSPAAIIGS
jgi:hypothetical protein